jgi:two-component system OmpR family sensor kinase
MPNLDDVVLAQLDELNRHLVTARLASATVHDARNALQAISGTAELITMGRGPDPQLDLRVSSIQQQCGELGNRLEAYRRIQAPGPGGQTSIRLSDLVGHAISLRRTSWGRLRITDFMSVPDDVVVKADLAGLLRILLNLLLNAERSLIETGGGLVSLSAELHGDLVILTVEDSGPGVSADVEPHLFQTTGPNGRLTTGLWTSARLAEAGGARVRWLGAEGRRAAFTVELPGEREA